MRTIVSRTGESVTAAAATGTRQWVARPHAGAGDSRRDEISVEREGGDGIDGGPQRCDGDGSAVGWRVGCRSVVRVFRVGPAGSQRAVLPESEIELGS